jgi:hypothetical protein
MWKVRMVSCVPGSPMDWAAMMPTESPIFATLLVAGLMPYDLASMPCSLVEVSG